MPTCKAKGAATKSGTKSKGKQVHASAHGHGKTHATHGKAHATKGKTHATHGKGHATHGKAHATKKAPRRRCGV